MGAAAFAAFAAFRAVLLVYDAPLRWAGRWVQRLRNAILRKRPPLEGLGLLMLAEVDSSQAVLAPLTYRIASYWLPLCAGPIAYGLFRIRYRSGRASPNASVARAGP